jgi:hypothetical protein
MPTVQRPDRRAIRILARSLARDLATTDSLIALASALIAEASERLRAARAGEHGTLKP